MPLSQGKSKKAFSKNVSTEMDAGKPQKQALAIAYAVKRRAKKAMGGNVTRASHDVNQKLHPHSGEQESMKEHKCPGCGMAYAQGGMVPHDNTHVAQDHLDELKGLEDGEQDQHESKMERIIPSVTSPESSNSAGGQYTDSRKRLMKMYDHMAEGGMVNDNDGDEDSLDHKNQRDSGDDLYNDLGLTDTYPQFDKEESNTMAQDMGEDEDKMKKKSRMGRIFEREYDHS